MEFKIQKKDFLKSLERTLTVVERRSTMPSLNHALFEVKDGNIQVSATDLEIFVTSSVPCKTLTEGKVSVPARSIYDIVRECKDNEEILVKGSDGTKLEITSGKSVFKLLGLSAESFPHFKASPKGQLSTAVLPSKDFAQLLDKTDYSVSTEEMKYFLTGVYLESLEQNGKNYLRAVATDGHRLVLKDMELKGKDFQLKKGLIIPKKGSNELKKILESCEEKEFELTCDENLIRAKIGENQLWIRPIDGEYPNYKPVIPSQLKSVLKVNKEDFIQSLKKMALLVSDRSRVVTFEFSKSKLTLSTNNPDLGEAYDEISVKGDAGELKTGFNVKFFLEAISHYKGSELELHVGEKLQPAIVRSSEDPGYLSLVMPMRI